MSKVVTICGSMKFQKEMKKIAKELELKQGYVVIQCVYFEEGEELSKSDIELASKLHYEKIDISDAIYVVNVNGYIGNSTRKEIEYARLSEKEVLSLEPLNLD